MADHVKIEVLESRIEQLENIVFGDSDKDSNLTKCTDALSNVHNKVLAVASSKKAIKEIYTQMPSLKKFLDPMMADELLHSQSSKANTILSQDERIRDQAEKLEKIQTLDKAIDSEHIKVVTKMSGKLETLSSIHVGLQDASVELTDDIKAILASYDKFISLLMTQFVQWDKIVTELEQK